jgi:CHRD domain
MKSKLLISMAAAGILMIGGLGRAQEGKSLTVQLTGAAEVPGPGDPDGSGTATLTFDQDKGQVCFSISVSNIQTPTMAHIHMGAAGKAGGVKVPFEKGADGNWKGCANVDKAVLSDIMQNPGNYYVNVHTAEFPNGAVRGQLTK